MDNKFARLYFWGLIAIFTTLFSLGLLVGRIWPGCKAALLNKRGIPTAARVVDWQVESVGYTSYIFHVNNIEYSGGYTAENKAENVSMGDTIEVIYLPSDPDINGIKEELNGGFANFFSLFVSGKK
jgi:hypothetical protein